MTDHELLRRAAIIGWFGALLWFAINWLAGAGWVGPAPAFLAWSYAAGPVFAATVLLARTAGAGGARWQVGLGLAWAALLAFIYASADWTDPPSFLRSTVAAVAVFALYSLTPVGITYVGVRALGRARPAQVPRTAGRPWHAIAALSFGGAIAVVWGVYLVARPTHTFVAAIEAPAGIDGATVVWESVLRPVSGSGEDILQTYARIRDSAGGPAIFGRFFPGAAAADREFVLEQLKAHPYVTVIRTGTE